MMDQTRTVIVDGTHEDYLELAKETSKKSHCLRSHFGAVIVKDSIILGVGYNGPARGVKHCSPCLREGCESGVGYNLCIAVHAEVNAIIHAGGLQHCLGATLYLGSHNRTWDGKTKYNQCMGDFPCDNCARFIIQAGIACVVQEENGKMHFYNINELVRLGRLR